MPLLDQATNERIRERFRRNYDSLHTRITKLTIKNEQLSQRLFDLIDAQESLLTRYRDKLK